MQQARHNNRNWWGLAGCASTLGSPRLGCHDFYFSSYIWGDASLASPHCSALACICFVRSNRFILPWRCSGGCAVAYCVCECNTNNDKSLYLSCWRNPRQRLHSLYLLQIQISSKPLLSKIEMALWDECFDDNCVENEIWKTLSLVTKKFVIFSQMQILSLYLSRFRCKQ